jgi:hypothetical protein
MVGVVPCADPYRQLVRLRSRLGLPSLGTTLRLMRIGSAQGTGEGPALSAPTEVLGKICAEEITRS